MNKLTQVSDNFTTLAESLALAGLQVVFDVFDGDPAVITNKVTMRYIADTGKYLVSSDAGASRYSDSKMAIKHFLRQAVWG